MKPLLLSVLLSWSPSRAPDLAYYHVELRSTDATSALVIDTVDPSATLQCKHQVPYFLSISAVSFAGLRSPTYSPLSFQLP